MTTDKDCKRLIRDRMSKTGESYTSARSIVLAKSGRFGGSPALPTAAAPGQWADLTGISDASVRAKTGRDWADWVRILDTADAFRLSHRDIARHLAAEHPALSGWWVQTVAVGYERIRGLRDVGQRRDGAYEAGKSRTYAVDVPVLYRWFHEARRRRLWLGDAAVRVRTATENTSIRFDWQDGSRVHAYFKDKGSGKSAVAIQHVGLASKADVDQVKRDWTERLDRLAQSLTPQSRGRPGSAR